MISTRATRFFVSPYFWMGVGMLLMGLLFAGLGFMYEDPRYEEAGVVQNLRASTWISMRSGGTSGYVEIRAVDTGTQRRWTLPLRTALEHQDRLVAVQGKYVKVIVAGEQAKEILQLVRDDETIIPLEQSLRYKAQGRAWFGWGGVMLISVGMLLWFWQWLAAGKSVVSIKVEPI